MKTKTLHILLEKLNNLYSELLSRYQEALGESEKISEALAQLHIEVKNPEAGDNSLSRLTETLEHRQKIFHLVDSLKNNIQPLEVEVQATLHLKYFDLEKIIQVAGPHPARELAVKREQLTGLLLKIVNLDQANQKVLVQNLDAVAKGYLKAAREK